MAKIQGLAVIERDSVKGSAEYIYKGVRIAKYTQERGYKTKNRGGYSRAGVKFTFKIHIFRANASVKTNYIISKNFTLKETIAEIESWFSCENVAVEQGSIIKGVSDRELLRAQGEYSG